MRDHKRAILGAFALAATLVLGRGAAAQAQDDPGYGDGYQEGNYGRIRYADGGASILRADGSREDGERSGLNAPIFPGDTVRTGSDQRVEIQLASGSIVRLDRGTSVVFQSMPDPYAKFQDNAVLVLQGGVMRVQARLLDKEEFRVDTDGSSIYLVGEGDFRIENDGRGRTSVASLRGVAEVVGSGGSVLVRGGSRTTVISGSDPEDPRAYSAYASDGFDRWCDIRDQAYRDTREDATVRNDVPYEAQPYYHELSSYGSWVTVPDYGRVWYPSGVYAGWRPYYDGYWSYGPGGYFWVSSEPWGWAPYHYGSWAYVGTYGWCWVPGHVFAGAWVSWSWGSAYFGWAPLNYYGYPCYRYAGAYRYGYYDPDCWTFVGYGNAYATNVRRYAVPVNRVGTDLKTATVVTRAPHVPPSRLAVSADARARAVREVTADRAAAIRPNGNGNRTMRDISNDVLRRNPRTGDRTAVAPAERFPRKSLQDDRGTSVSPNTRERLAQPRGNGNGGTIDRHQVQGNERRAVEPRGNGGGNNQRLERPQVQQENDRRSVAPRSHGNGNNERTIERPQTQGNERSAYPRRLTADPRSNGNGNGNRREEQATIDRGNGNDRRSVDQPSVERQQLQRSNGNGNNQRVERAQPQRSGDSRSNVRELYERMSRPRETRSAEPGRAPARVEPSRPRPQQSAPQASPQRSAPQRSQPQRQAPAPRGNSGGGQKAQPRGNGGGNGHNKH